jgi:hypothetical protein
LAPAFLPSDDQPAASRILTNESAAGNEQRRFLRAADHQLSRFGRKFCEKACLGSAKMIGRFDRGTFARLRDGFAIGLHRVFAGAKHDG